MEQAPFNQCPMMEKLQAVSYDTACGPNQSCVELRVRVNCLHLRHKGGVVSRGEEYYCNRVSYYRHEKNQPHPSIKTSISLAIHPFIDPNIQPIRKHHHETWTVCAVCAILEAPQQFQPAEVPSKEINITCTRQKMEQIIGLQIPKAIIFQSIHSF